MRRHDREITDFDEITDVLTRCDTIRLGIYAGQFPYVVPLSFGFEACGKSLKIYFHCAKEGRKIELIKANPCVCAEADVLHGYVDTGHSVTADYESVIMTGTVTPVEGAEAVKGLELLLKHCRVEGYSAEACAARGITAVYRLDVSEISGKRRFNNANRPNSATE